MRASLRVLLLLISAFFISSSLIGLQFSVVENVAAFSTTQERAATLAKSRINDALSLLSTLLSNDLASKCKTNLRSVQASLAQSGQCLDNERIQDAKEQLNVVVNLLNSCLNLIETPKDDVSATTLVDLRATIRRVSSSVSSAEELLEIAQPPKMSSLGILNATIKNNTNNSNPSSNSSSNVVENLKAKPDFVTTSLNNSTITQSTSTPTKPTFLFDYCGDHVTLQSNSAIIRMDQSCGAKLHSTQKFSSGVFSARIRTPVKGTGVSNNFYLSSNDQGSDVIGFEFLGNFPNRVLTSYTVNGNAGGNQQLFVLSYDTSVNFHTYTIKWDNESIVWLADNIVLRTLYKSNSSLGYPKKAASIFCHTWDASSVGDGSYAGKVNWKFGPFRAYFTDVVASSPLVSGLWKAPMLASAAALSIVSVPMRPFAIDYCFSNVAVAANDLSITFDQAGCGGRFRSITTYPSGTFTSRVKCAAGDTSGLLSSFYLSSLEGSKVQDEIDFEWLGKDKSSVQTNYYVNGVGNHEVQIPLGFDCSQAYHTYTIIYNIDQIQWLVDGRTVRIVTRTKEAMVTNPYPVKPVYVYASVWNASSINNGGWSGKWRGTNLPYTVYFSDVRIKSP
ncbi:hypothetical protein L7F22_051544 [Adiantum nelumboides]|nr:hypothetical protein [Adiantum nelumboides]